MKMKVFGTAMATNPSPINLELKIYINSDLQMTCEPFLPMGLFFTCEPFYLLNMWAFLFLNMWAFFTCEPARTCPLLQRKSTSWRGWCRGLQLELEISCRTLKVNICAFRASFQQAVVRVTRWHHLHEKPPGQSNLAKYREVQQKG